VLLGNAWQIDRGTDSTFGDLLPVIEPLKVAVPLYR
jgi:hypothetical protein